MKKKFLNNAQQRALLVNPWSYFGVMGRGSGKSIGILAGRASKIAYAMPGAALGWYGDSYINLQSNLIPGVIKGWNDLGYIEGIHFVRDQEPPGHFSDSLFFPKTYKHTIVWHTGTIFFLISDDRPDSARGRSLQHILGDEVKLINYDKMKKAVFPAIRGERIHFGKNPFFQGFTFTTDMPDREDGQWLLEKEKLMNPKQIEMIALLQLQQNKLKLQQLQADDLHKYQYNAHIQALEKKLNLYRYKSVYYDTASTFVNLDALGLDTIDNLLMSLGWHEFKISVLNILPDTIENLFYSGFTKRHLYSAINYDYYDNFGLRSDIDKTSIGDKDINHTKPLDAGMDFGNMNSLVIGQEWGNEFRALKFMHALDPLKISDLAKMFTNYYKFHKNKVLNYYYDRAANARRPDSNISYAEEFRREILRNDSAWRITLKSIGWPNVPHQDRRLLWINILDDGNTRYPSFRMNEPNCQNLKSSMQLAPTKVVDGVVKKDKRSERKRLELLPSQSTNPSDALDYLIWGKYSSRLPKQGSARAYTVSSN